MVSDKTDRKEKNMVDVLLSIICICLSVSQIITNFTIRQLSRQLRQLQKLQEKTQKEQSE